MPFKKTIVGLITVGAVAVGGDSTIMNEKALSRIENVAGERVEVIQVEDVVQSHFPWKGENGITVKYDMGKPSLKERIADKRKQEVVTELVDFGDGSMKVDILLNEKPDTNVFCYAIEGAENYDFFFQPPLTEQEKAEGASRPPEIEGSYAVYHKTLKNHEIGKENYATGKVMHIPRPQVWSMSDVDTKVWADMTYDNGNLCVTVPQDFLNGADYPVRVDPTLGYTSIGGTAVNDGGTTLYGRVTATEGGDLSGITIYCNWNFTGSSAIGSAWYTDSAGDPNTKTYTTTGQADCQSSTPGWRAGTLTGSFTAGANYWIGMYNGSGNIRYYYDATGTSEQNTGFVNLPATATGSNTNTNRDYSVYVTYTSVATTTPTVTTSDATNVGATTVTVNGNITSDGNAQITEHGFAYGTDSGLSGGNTSTTTLGTGVEGVFSQSLTVNPMSTYYFRAYGTNASGTATGVINSFTTPSTPRARINNGTIRINNGKLDI